MEILLYIIFLLILAGVILFAYYKRYHGRKNRDYLDFFSIFSMAFFLYTSIGALDHIGSYGEKLFVPITVYISIVIGYIAFQRGYNGQIGKWQDKAASNIKIKFCLFHSIKMNKKSTVCELLMIISFLFFMFMNLEQMKYMVLHFGSGVSYVATAMRAERTAFSGPLSLFRTFFTLFMLGLPAIRVCKEGRVTPIDLFLIIILGTYSIASGHRTTLLIIGFEVLAILNYKHKYISIVKLGAFGLIAMFFFIALGHLRASSDIIGMIHRIADVRSYMLKITSSGEFYNTVGTFYEYVEAIYRGSYSYNFGYSWVVDILIFIPFFLFPDRPLPWSEQFMKDFHPEAPAGTGHGWFILNDGYMAFGVIGLALEMYIMGFVLAKLYIFLRENMDNYPIITYIYILLMSYVFLLTRSNFLGAIKNSFLELFPFIIIYYITVDRRKVKRNKEAIKAVS